MRVLDIGISDGLDTGVSTEWLTQEAATALLSDRPGDANKGNFGRAFIAAGSANYIGAALLATSAAVRSGAGLVYLATRESVYRLVAGRVEEAIYHPLPENAQGRLDAGEAVRVFLADSQGASALLIGPGLGQANDTVQFVEQLCRSLREDTPVILDADALNILSRVPGWWDRVRSPKILTPHPGEMARLMDCRVQDVQEDRPGVAADAAAKFNATVVLKGAATIITAPDGRTRVSPWVNPGLAKGGTGDVLAGLMAGIAAQTPETLFDVASLAVYLHGLAGQLARDQHGEAGMTAGDVALAIPGAFTALAP
jgi:NAD(P)H-hydrate epimerase